MEQKTHHKWSMSKLNSLRACARYENQNTQSAASEEGTKLHKIAQDMIEKWVASRQTTFSEFWLGNLDFVAQANDLKPEQKACLQMVFTDVEQFIDRAEEIWTEEKMEIKNLDGSTLNYGTADLICLGGRRATLVDFKFGRDPVKDVSENLQGQGYALALFQLRPDIDQIEVLFIQPRDLNSPPNSGSFDRRDMGWIFTDIYRTIENAEDKSTPPFAGEHCVYCAKKGTCSAYLSLSTAVVKKYYDLPAIPTFHGTEISNPHDMAAAFWVVKQVEPIVKSVKAAAVEMAKQGHALEFEYCGKLHKYQLIQAEAARELTSIPLVYDIVKDVMDAELFIGCLSKCKVGDLEKFYAEARVAQEEKSGRKMTKKAAIEELRLKLSAEGLLVQEGAQREYLRDVKEKTNKKELATT